MQYIIHFEISAVIILLVIMGDYFRHKKIPTVQNKTYGWFLIFSIAGCILNIVTVLAAEIALYLPRFLLFVLNVGFLLATGIAAALFFVYTVSLAGKLRKLHSAAVFLMLFPIIFETIAILTSWYTGKVFYFDEFNQYQQGPFHWTLYITYFFYGGASVVWTVFMRRKIGERRTILIFFCFFLTSIFVVIQYFQPQYLLIGLSVAVPMMVLYHTIQNPYNQMDSLTKCYSRGVLVPYLKEFFESKIRFALYVYALDDFKMINSIVGIKNGDMLLNKVASHLENTYQKSKVFRLGGDQFAVVLSHRKIEKRDVQNAGVTFPDTWSIEGMTLQLSSCVLGFNGLEYSSVSELLTAIDYAISTAKNEGKGSFRYVDASYREQSLLNKKIEEALFRAIEKNSFEIYLQPIVSSKENKVIAAEALVRMEDEVLGFVSPDLFIKIAEQNGTINRIGSIVLEKVCQFLEKNDIKKWGMSHIDVNLSVIQCMQEDLEEQIFATLEKYGIDPAMIDFEITETAAASFAVLEKNIRKIYERGISFSLDDFGTGFSNMEYIVRLPFDTIKLDKNLFWTAISNNSKTEFFKNIACFIKNMGLSVICEGAETQAHMDYLADVKIDCVQGYFYSPPLKVSDFVKFMNYFNEKNNTLS